MGNLISRSELLKHSRKVTEYDEAGYSRVYRAVSVEDIKYAPTVEARKVVHGEWIDDTGCLDSVRQYKCSNCGSKPITNFAYNTILSNFCPNCGAKMKELENE